MQALLSSEGVTADANLSISFLFLDNLPPDTHVSAIGQPRASLPDGQLTWSGAQTGGHEL